MLRQNHVVVVVIRKMGMEPFTGLARLTVSDIVGKNNKILVYIEKLARPKKNSGKLRTQERSSSAAGAVQEEHGICRLPIRILPELTECVGVES